jgi:hypothetical protein
MALALTRAPDDGFSRAIAWLSRASASSTSSSRPLGRRADSSARDADENN